MIVSSNPVEIGIFLLLILTKTNVESTPKHFFKRSDKRLIGTPIETFLVDFPEQCIGACMFNDRCKAFNADHDNCQLFEKDRSSQYASLVHSHGTSYFDTVAKGFCPGEL